MPGTTSVYAERTATGRYLDVDIDRIAAGRYGLNIKDVQDIVGSAVGGMTVSYTVEGLERYPINLRYPQDFRGFAAERCATCRSSRQRAPT